MLAEVLADGPGHDWAPGAGHAAKTDAAAKSSDKPAAAADKGDAKPAKPKAAAKPATKPAPKNTTGDAGASDQRPHS